MGNIISALRRLSQSDRFSQQLEDLIEQRPLTHIA